MKAKDINTVVGKFLKDRFNDYKMDKTKRKATMRIGDKLFVIGWENGCKYSDGGYYVSFYISARFCPVDDLYDSIWSDDLPPYDFIIKPLSQQKEKVYTLTDLDNYLKTMLSVINAENKKITALKAPMDFLNESLNNDSLGAVFAIKRMMLCELSLPQRKKEIHLFNLNLWSDRDDTFYQTDYLAKLKSWDEYYADMKR